MPDNTAFWLVARFNPRDRTKKSWKYFNFLLSGQQRRRINRNQKFLLMNGGCADFVFVDPVILSDPLLIFRNGN
jgi:hypothetical protein